MNIRDAILSRLGTSHDVPGEVAAMLLFVAMLGVVVGFEALVGLSIGKLARCAWRRISEEFDKANR